MRHLCLALAIAAPALGQANLPPVATQPVMLLGNTVVDGEVLDSQQAPVIGPNGEIGFVGGVLGDSGSRLYRWVGGTVQVLGRSTDFVPGTTRSIGDFHSVIFDRSGAMVIEAVNDVLHGVPGQYRLIASTQAPTPSDTFIQMGDQHYARFTPSGSVGVESNGLGGVRTIWTGNASQLVKVATNVNAVANLNATVQVRHLARYDSDGSAYFQGLIQGLGFSNQYTIFRSGPALGQTTALIAPNAPAPGMPGVVVDARRTPSVNASGTIAMNASVLGPDNVTRNVVFGGRAGQLSPIAVSGQQAPGMPQGATFRDLDAPLVSGSGDIAVFGFTNQAGFARWGAWLSSSSGLTKMFAAGDSIAGMPSGTTFAGITTDPASVAINSRNQISLIGAINTPTSSGNLALLGYDPQGGLMAIAVQGRPFQVGAGDTRVVSTIAVANTGTFGSIVGVNGDDGIGSWLNDQGQTVYMLEFTDGSRATFVSTIPAPGTFAIIAGAGLLSVRRRRSSASLHVE